ncbi:hypothetical protein JAO73_03715 [Hymenobacter sp. BT523]|uniref:hypothetical protein n=1 Tax=Hymenobacter sp. BT523 TaxID=2795725 RepID=UPI0018EC4661|nr:hypothetical protein [Hymenobacter sp. BT523]MBJ6108105.1 hypothetical protein [Hymenobacter sp. BT523]
MKQLITPLAHVPGLLGLFRLRTVSAVVAWVVLAAFGPLVTGCNYYRTKTQPADKETVNLLAQSKTFVVHQGSTEWVLRQPHFNGEALEGTRESATGTLAKYSELPTGRKTPRYLSKDKKVALNIVHVYVNDAQPGTGDQVSIPFSAIKQIDLVEKDSGRTTASYVLGTLGVTAGVFALLLVIVALTKSSCPFVYAFDGQTYHFEGEAYGGAIFAPAERDDYLPVPALQPKGNQYRLKISNELKERQYTNLAELWVAQHPAGTQVLLDQRGQVQTLTAPQPATQARTLGGHDCTAQLQAADHSVELFSEDLPGHAPNEVVLTFAKPAAARHGKLVLRAQNSLWLDYLYGRFIEKFGAAYNGWAAQQKTQPAAVNRQWALDQHIPLQVYVEAGQGWQLAETIPTVGPLAARDVVVPLDFPASAAGTVRVKLACGFMFWEVDYAALDCSPNAPVQLDNCHLQSARTERGDDARAALRAADTLRLKQLHAGTVVDLTYETRLPAPAAGMRRTAFLHTRGYYEHVREFSGLPKLTELYAFKKPGRFVAFSKEEYRRASQQFAPAIAQR